MDHASQELHAIVEKNTAINDYQPLLKELESKLQVSNDTFYFFIKKMTFFVLFMTHIFVLLLHTGQHQWVGAKTRPGDREFLQQ
jgi:hypothetical protein